MINPAKSKMSLNQIYGGLFRIMGYILSSQLIIFLIIIGLHLSNSIIAYDCSSKDVNYTTISLVDVPKCEYSTITPSIFKSHGAIVQYGDYVPIKFVYCKIHLMRRVQDCASWGSSEDVSYDLAGYPIEITKSLCEEIHKRLEYSYTSDIIIKDLVMNTTNEKGQLLAGITDLSGRCTGRQWKDKYGDYPNVVVNGIFTIGIRTGSGLLDISTGKVKLDSNTQCAYGTGECMDFERGQYFWNIDSHMNCEDKLLIPLYRGEISIISYNNTRMNPIDYVTVNHNGVLIAVKIESRGYICNHEIYHTNIERLVVFTKIDPYNNLFNTKHSIENINNNIYYLTKLTGIDIHLYTHINSLYTNILYNQCLLEKETISIKLHIGMVDPIEFAYIFNNGPGATAITSGGRLFI